MALRTYRLVVAETETGEDITADVYNEEGTLAESARIPYEDHGLTVDREGDAPSEREHTFQADVTTMQLQTQRVDGAFDVSVLGDGETVHSERLTDEEWGLTSS
ncbi:hypothetical protein [Halomarina litorea]|uniref:hypothetical protein n=1 Tax=Halomarina litorea TaxID=2961595 RepID=UPI0020C2EB05|nr:hypothetical protein [Halomarina sp. BCD28]